MEEEDLQKRITDCVFFLASPFTCKKGLDCEYRHNEIARLNPRDCWYWLAGNCVNPTCGFRHPPLDTHKETSAESAKLPPKNSSPANKSSAPCYFYFNGFCEKGDRCFFLHGNDSITASGKSVRTDFLPTDNETPTEIGSGSAPNENHQNPSETPAKPTTDIIAQRNRDFKQSSLTSSDKQSVSQKIPDFDSQKVAVVKPDSLALAEGSFFTKSPTYTDQSLEEPRGDLVEPKERWESSPGFDVREYITSENFGNEDDLEHLAVDRNWREHVEVTVEYDDPMYPDIEHLYRRHEYDDDVHDQLDNVFIFNNLQRPSINPRERMFNTLMSRDRKRLLPVEMEVNSQDFLDVRDRLSKRGFFDASPTTSLSGRHQSFSQRREKKPQRHGMGCQLYQRSSSDIVRESIKSFGASDVLLNGIKRGNSRPNRFRKFCSVVSLGKWHSHNSKKPFLREKMSARASTMFQGPKTLAQIKEEKKKAGDRLGNKRQFGKKAASTDFQGPKPLSEILENKIKKAESCS